jgi:hypothetical protein
VQTELGSHNKLCTLPLSVDETSKRTNPQKICHFVFFSKLKIPTKALEGSKWVLVNYYLLVYLPLALGGQGTFQNIHRRK